MLCGLFEKYLLRLLNILNKQRFVKDFFPHKFNDSILADFCLTIGEAI